LQRFPAGRRHKAGDGDLHNMVWGICLMLLAEFPAFAARNAGSLA
jgi:hypothetical protein